MIFLIPLAQAAADSEVISLATSTAQTLVDNIMGALTAILPIAVLAGAAVMAVWFTVRFVKGIIKGR